MTPKGKNYIEWAHQTVAEKNAHVSLPQMKYPSLRDEGLKDPIQWLEGKALDDAAEGLWRKRDGLYDFDDFQDKHPGGAEWLELSKGTDITEAFECHHLNPVVEKIKEKYYIRDAQTPRNSPFTFKEDGFYKTLKRDVGEVIKKVPNSESKQADYIIDSLFATVLLSSAISCWATSYWVVMTSYLAASLALAWTTVASHSYLHMKTNWRMYPFNLTMMSYRDSRVSHVLSHHLYPNTVMGLEISAFEPIIFWNPRKKSSYSYFSFLIELVFYPFIAIINFLKRHVSLFIRKDFFNRHYRWHDCIGFLLPLWIYFASGSTLFHAASTWFWIICTTSFIIYAIGTNAAHHHPDIFKDGDQLKNTTVDWGMHELEAVMDRTDINSSLFTSMTFFGDHALHHLFPTLDHVTLKRLYPVFLKRCEQFRVNFRLTSSFDLFIGQLRMAVKEDPNVLDKSK